MTQNTAYIVSARKYRPSTFHSVVGQKALTATLKNAIDSQRLAQAYLFCGPRGVGKTSCARIFAKTINCLSPTPDGEACGVCESCRAIDQGNSFNLVELDAASNNSVDDIRSITEQVNVPPQNGRYRVFIIDEVHMLSNAAFNAFLKTLEEPPKYVVFILATTEKHKVIPTILSRCQIYDFKRITVTDMIDHLEYVASQEGIHADRDALGIIALKADGAMRDALSIFDQVSASSRGNVTYANTIASLNVLDYDYYFKLVDAFRNGEISDSLLLYKEIRDKGFDSLFFINGLAAHIRDLMVAADPRTLTLLETSTEVAEKYAIQAKSLPAQWYYAALRLLSDCDLNYRIASGKRLLVELTLIRLCQLLKPATPPFDSIDRQLPLGDPVKEHSATTDPKTSSKIASTETISDSLANSSSTKAPDKVTPDEISSSYHHEHNTEPPISKPETTHLATRNGRRPSSFRISDRKNETVSYSHNETRENPITKENFQEAWNIFIARNPDLHILVNAMRSATPEMNSDSSFLIKVGHPAQVQAFELSMPKLIEFLRNKLSNDRLTLKVEVNDSPASATQLPPKEFLSKCASDNPVLGKFLADINAELA